MKNCYNTKCNYSLQNIYNDLYKKSLTKPLLQPLPFCPPPPLALKPPASLTTQTLQINPYLTFHLQNRLYAPPPAVLKKKQALIHPTPSLSLYLNAQKMYQCYLNAKKSPFLVIGGSDLRLNFWLIKNLGTLSLQPQYNAEKIKSLFERLYPLSTLDQLIKTHLTCGSVVADEEWTVLENDFFMLGTIHAAHEIHLGSMPTVEMIWNPRKNRPRILGRELLMLSQAGYCPYQSLEEIIFLPPSQVSRCLYLPEIYDEIDHVKSLDPILEYLAKRKPA